MENEKWRYEVEKMRIKAKWYKEKDIAEERGKKGEEYCVQCRSRWIVCAIYTKLHILNILNMLSKKKKILSKKKKILSKKKKILLRNVERKVKNIVCTVDQVE